MKTYTKAAAVLCLSALSVIMGIAAYKSGGELESEMETVAAMSYSEPKEESYCLRDCDGLVAVYYCSDMSSPVTVTDIETDTLNNNDRSLLQNGITAENKNELISLLEDLGS